MRNYFTALFLVCCVILLGQQKVKIIESGELTLMTDEVIPFTNLEFGKDKVTYINTNNNEKEFLYRFSIKEISGQEKLIEKEVIELTEHTAKAELSEEEIFKTYTYKDQTIKLPITKDKAVVYFVRTNASGFLIGFDYFDGEDFIGEFAGRGYIRYECEPGEHIFWASSENKSFVKANVEAGKIYVIEVVPVLGIVKAQSKLLTMISDNDNKRKKQRKRILKIFADKNFDYTPSKEELEKNLHNYKDKAQRALKTYDRKLSKNKVEFIEPNQEF